MKQLSILVFCLNLTIQAYAQGIDVRGIIADSASGERVPYANVVIRSTGKGTTSNLNGFYLITNVSQGTYEIVASSVGYRSTAKKITVHGTEPMVVNFLLPQQTVEFSEVVVESERNLEKLDAASVHMLGPREIQQIPAAGQTDVLRSLLILPGIVSTSDVSAKFFVRGGAGDQNLILVDGIRVYNPFHAFGIFSIFDPDLINTTEVHTGAFPAGYGNRLSSVVNMTTRQGNINRIAGRGEINFLHAKAQLEGPITDDNSWLVNGRTSLSEGAFSRFLHNSVPLSFYDFFFKGTLGNATGRNSFVGFFTGDNVVSERDDEADHSWRSQALAATFSGLASNRIYFDGIVYTSLFKVRRDPKNSLSSRPAESSIGDDGLRAELTIHTEESGILFAGFQVDLPEYKFTYTSSSNIERTFTSINSEVWLWIRQQREFGNLQTDVGIHSDLVSLFDGGKLAQTFQPRLSLTYKLSELWRTRFSFGVYNQRVIAISNEDDITPLFDAWIPLPDDLQPEEAHHYVFGLEGFLSSRLSLGIQSYYKNYLSLVLYNRQKYFPTDPDYVTGTGEAYGAELLTRFGSRPLDLYLAYSLGWTTVAAGDFGYSPRYDRRHTINALAVYHPTEDIDISLRWEFGSGYPYTQTIGYYDRLLVSNLGGVPFYNETGIPYSILGEKNSARLPAYYRIDASISHRFRFPSFRGSVSVNAANLTNRKNILFYDRKTGQQINMLEFFPSATLKVEF